MLLQGSSNLLSVREISLSSREQQGRAWLCSAQVCVMGQGTVIMRHSGTSQVFRDQRCNDRMTIPLANVHIRTTELPKAFIRDFGGVKSHAEIAHAIRTYGSKRAK